MKKHTYKKENKVYKSCQVITELDNEDGEIYVVTKTRISNTPAVKRWHITIFCDGELIFSDFWKNWSACCTAYDKIVNDYKNNGCEVR